MRYTCLCVYAYSVCVCVRLGSVYVRVTTCTRIVFYAIAGGIIIVFSSRGETSASGQVYSPQKHFIRYNIHYSGYS